MIRRQTNYISMKFLIIFQGIFYFLFTNLASATNTGTPYPTVDVTVTPSTQILAPANPKITGTNFEWFDNMVSGSAHSLIPANLLTLQGIAPSVIRYPGGTSSDGYNWNDGVGSTRNTEFRYPMSYQSQVNFGTNEFVQLTNQLGADALITANIFGPYAPSQVTANLANIQTFNVNWLNQIKAAGGKAKYWEIGNEPYLTTACYAGIANCYNPSSSTYVTLANNLIPALKQADPSILIGVPLRSPQMNSLPVTVDPNYLSTVLSGVPASSYDFAALHFYMPGPISVVNNDTYYSLMGGSATVAYELQKLRNEFAAKGIASKPFAITEYNSFFTTDGTFDNMIQSWASSLFISDLLGVMAQQPDILFANYWSSIGDWYFGSADENTGAIRNAGTILGKFKSVMVGNVYQVTATGPTFNSKSLNYIAAQTNLPVVSSLVTIDGTSNSGKVWLVNRHLTNPMKVKVHFNSLIQSGVANTLTSSGVWDTGQTLQWASATPVIYNQDFYVTLPAHSVGYVSVVFQSAVARREEKFASAIAQFTPIDATPELL